MSTGEWFWKTNDGLKIYSKAWLPAGKTRALVCLIHGIGEHVGRYEHVAEALVRAGFGLAGFDQRGHGRSEGARGHLKSLQGAMDDITSFLAEINRKYPGNELFIYGHSLGATWAINYALAHQPQLKGVIATGPAFRLNFQPPPIKVFLGRTMNQIMPGFSQPSGLDTAALSRDPQVEKDYRADPLVHDVISARLFTAMMDSGAYSLKHAGELQLPLLLMAGGSDRIISPDAVREFAGHHDGLVTLKIWDGFFHEIHNETGKDQVFKVMIDWLKKNS